MQHTSPRMSNCVSLQQADDVQTAANEAESIGAVTQDFETYEIISHAATVVVWCPAVQRLFKNFNSTQNIQSTPYSCSFKCLILIQIWGHVVTYRSAVGHTVSCDTNSQARVHQVWIAAKCETFRTGLHFRSDAFACVWMEVNGIKSAVWLALKSQTLNT